MSCATPTACMAVGGEAPGEENSNPAAFLWNGMSWTPESVPIPSGGTDTENFPGDIPSHTLASVSCTAPASCTTVGFDGVIESWNGHAWAAGPITVANFNAIDCVSTARCLAAGLTDAETAGNEYPVVAAGSVQGLTQVAQAATVPVEPEAVALRPDGLAMVVGYTGPGDSNVPFVEIAPPR